ncbi:DUF6390 family protein [Patescibacteria group bacterium]
MSGLKLAAIYGFPPFKLGFCGPEGEESLDSLIGFIKGEKVLAEKSRKILSRFVAAYPYYRLIANSNRIKNPFDKKVVEAYWLGNQLLDNIPPSALKKMILNDFYQPGLPDRIQLKKTVATIPAAAKAHHSFHVLFIGSVTGKVEFTDKVRDICRIGWGRVNKIKNQSAGWRIKIKNRPLKQQNDRYYLAEETKKEINWDRDFVPQVKIGDIVSFHWGQACQVLNKKEVENLEKYTQLNIKAFNTQILSSSFHPPGD